MPDDLKALADLLERHDKAMTPGEWRPAPPQQYENDSITYIGGLGRVVGTSSADQAGIAALRNALPSLVAALRRAVRVREALKESAVILEAQHGSIVWELSPTMRAAIAKVIPMIRAALTETADER